MSHSILSDLDISEEAGNAYFILLESGPYTATQAAGFLGMPRTSAYVVLNQLVDRGLASSSEVKGVKVFYAEPAEKLSFLFDQAAVRLVARREECVRMLESIVSSPRRRASESKVQMFEGEAGLKRVLKDSAACRDATVHVFWPAANAADLLGEEFLRDLSEEQVENNIRVLCVVTDRQAASLAAEEAHELQEVRVLPGSASISMGYWVCEDRCAFISFGVERSGFIVESAEMAEMLRLQHQVAWNSSVPLF